MTEKKRNGAAPGSNNGGGRRKSKVPLKNWSGNLQIQQGGERWKTATVRLAIDTLEAITNAFGSTHFSVSDIENALKDVPKNGSLIALLNILSDLEKVAKENY